jgi:predicted nucleotide-binding protein
MTLEQMRIYITKFYNIVTEKEISNGTQIKLDNDAIINVFNNGNYNIQGKNSEKVKECFGEIEKSTNISQTKQKSNKVFIVYGHDEQARNELENLIRRWGLEPVILDKIASGGKTIIEKLESQMPDIEYGIVLATADDEGYRKGVPNEKMFRCRQNVVLELGMLLSKLGRDRIAILQQHPKETERPSDIQGLLYIPFENSIDQEAAKILAREIEDKLGIIIPASRL